MLAHGTPFLTLDQFARVTVGYDRDDDMLLIYANEYTPAVTEILDNGWHLRVADEEIVGLEFYGLKTRVLVDPYYAKAFAPVIRELESHSGLSLDRDNIRADGPIAELPRAAQLFILLAGQATIMLEAILRSEYEENAK